MLAKGSTSLQGHEMRWSCLQIVASLKGRKKKRTTGCISKEDSCNWLAVEQLEISSSLRTKAEGELHLWYMVFQSAYSAVQVE